MATAESVGGMSYTPSDIPSETAKNLSVSIRHDRPNSEVKKKSVGEGYGNGYILQALQKQINTVTLLLTPN